MNSTGNTVDNITSMGDVNLTNTTYTVYLVQRENQSSHPEGGSVIFVKTEKDAGDIQASKGADDDIPYYRMAIRVDEIGESLMSIGTILARDYPGSWDEALKQLAAFDFSTKGLSVESAGQSRTQERRAFEGV
ncbi:hypothetical protein PENCOP_c008G07406 [Penicillium coprophilum]|uniref:Uncharacterized protein n=1 Tax=Penicillium coprophilum TaxID=36646 RepID=A0A1V6UIP7_9EURO|nr:hypothetical protein PENCOP_c008G07406 [Penicillium coprophilum]